MGFELLEHRLPLAFSTAVISEPHGEAFTTATVELRDGLNGYTGTRDTRIRGDQPTANYGKTSKLELDGSPDQISLIRWDTTSIPASSTVTAASITLNVLEPSAETYEVYEVLRPWDELTSTYLLASANQPWEVPGAAGLTDHASQVLAALTSSAKGLKTFILNSQGVAVVQKWISTPTSNFGIVVQDLANAVTDDLDVSSREQSGLGPKLTVTYTSEPPLPPSDPPTAINDSFAVAEDNSLIVPVASGVLSNDTDPDNGSLTAVLVSGPSKGALQLNSDGSFKYDPHLNTHGADQFVYRARNPAGSASLAATVSLTITSVNDAPLAIPQTVATAKNTARAITLTGSDVDGDALTFFLASAPEHGQLTGTPPQVSYLPDDGYSGPDSFTFFVRDGFVESSTATISINVAPPAPQYKVNHPPRLQLGDAPLTGFPGSAKDQVAILWETMPAGSGVHDSFSVEFHQVGEAAWSNGSPITTLDTGVEGRIIHETSLLGLNFNTDYEYRVQHLRAGTPVATYQATFHTRLLPNDVTPFSFAAYGDSAHLPNIDGFREVQRRINMLDSDFAVLLGDNIYNDGAHEQSDTRFDPAVNPEAVEWIASHIDYPSFGNHELHNGSLGKPTEEMFAVPIPVAGQNAPAQPPAGERPEHNYSFDYGMAHFVTFDTNSENNNQRLDALLAWVEQDLRASDAHWKIVIGHHPIAGAPDKSESPADFYYQQVVSRLRAAGADLFLAGHSHTYSHSYPLLGHSGSTATFIRDTDKDYAKGAGLVQVVSGVGGKEVRTGSFSQFPFIAAGFSTSTNPQGELGFAQVDVTPNRLRVSYVAASDGQVLDQFTITGGPPNLPPQALPESYEVDEDGVLEVLAVSGVLSNDSDPEDSPLIITLANGPGHGDLALREDGSFTYSPHDQWHGGDRFTYTISDGINAPVAAVVSIIVKPVNDAPVAHSQKVGTATNLPVSLILSAEDPDNDSLQYTVQDPPNGSISGTPPDVTYTPDSGFFGIDTFEFFVNDGTASSEPAVVSVLVRDNVAPQVDDLTVQTNEDETLLVILSASDDDGDTLTWQLLSSPSHGSLTGEMPNLEYKPSKDFNGTDRFEFKVNDGFVDSTFSTVSITVTSVNDPPIAQSITTSTNSGSAVAVTLIANDVDGDALTFVVVNGPTSGRLIGTPPLLTYEPDSGFFGGDFFTYKASDGTDSSEEARVDIAVSNPTPVTVSFRDGINGYSGTRDTRIRGDTPTTNYGTTNKLELDGQPDQVSLIRWDVSSIPVGSTITSASLTFNVITTSNEAFEVYEARRSWDEKTATFLLAASGTPWETPGAAGPLDRGSSVLGALSGKSTGTSTVPMNAQGVALVQKWVNDSDDNLGIVIQDLSDAATDDLDVSSREQVRLGPMLTVTYFRGPGALSSAAVQVPQDYSSASGSTNFILSAPVKVDESWNVFHSRAQFQPALSVQSQSTPVIANPVVGLRSRTIRERLDCWETFFHPLTKSIAAERRVSRDLDDILQQIAEYLATLSARRKQ